MSKASSSIKELDKGDWLLLDKGFKSSGGGTPWLGETDGIFLFVDLGFVIRIFGLLIGKGRACFGFFLLIDEKDIINKEIYK
jgi:hypothetical protein